MSRLTAALGLLGIAVRNGQGLAATQVAVALTPMILSIEAAGGTVEDVIGALPTDVGSLQAQGAGLKQLIDVGVALLGSPATAIDTKAALMAIASPTDAAAVDHVRKLIEKYGVKTDTTSGIVPTRGDAP